MAYVPRWFNPAFRYIVIKMQIEKKILISIYLSIFIFCVHPRSTDTLFSVPWIDNEQAVFLSGIGYSDEVFQVRAFFLHVPSWNIKYEESAIPVDCLSIPLLDVGFHFNVNRLFFSLSYLTSIIPDISTEVDSIISPQTITLVSSPFVGGSASVSQGDVCLLTAFGIGNGFFDIESTNFGVYSESFFWSSLSWRDIGTYCAFVRGDLSAAASLAITQTTGFAFDGMGEVSIDAYGLWGSFEAKWARISMGLLLSSSLFVNNGTNIIGGTCSSIAGEKVEGSISWTLERGYALFLLFRPSFTYKASRVVTVTVNRTIPLLFGWEAHSIPYSLSESNSGERTTVSDSVGQGVDLLTILFAGIGMSVSWSMK